MTEQMEVEIGTNMEVLLEKIRIGILQSDEFTKTNIFLTIKENKNNKEIHFQFYGL